MRILATGVCTLALLLTGTPASAQGATNPGMSFEMDTSFEVKLGDFVLPSGEYWLQQVGDSGVFVLFDGDSPEPSEAVAMIDTWRVPGPELTHPSIDARNQTQANFEYIDVPGGPDTIPELESWSIQGNRFKVRDVVSHDGSDFLERWIGD